MAEAKAPVRKGKVGKKYLAALAKISFGKTYSINDGFKLLPEVSYAVGSSRVDLQACKLEYSIVSPK